MCICETVSWGSRVGNKVEDHRADAQDMMHLTRRGVGGPKETGNLIVGEPGPMGGNMDISCRCRPPIRKFGVIGGLGGWHKPSACDAGILSAGTDYDHVAELSVGCCWQTSATATASMSSYI